MKNSIRNKLWLAMLALVVLVLGLAAFIQLGALQKIYYRQQAQRLWQEGEKLSEAILNEQDPFLVARQILLLSRVMNAGVMIIDSRGRILHWQNAGAGAGRGMGMGRHGMMNWESGAPEMPGNPGAPGGPAVPGNPENPGNPDAPGGPGGPGGRGGPPWGAEMTGPGATALPERQQVEKVFQGERVVTREYNPFFGTEVMVAGVPLRREKEVAAALFIYAPVAPLAANLKALQQVGLYALLAGALVATGLAFLVSRMLTGPLIQMNQVARAMAAGEFGRRISLRSGDEVGMLAESLNILSQKLQEKVAALEKVDQNRREFVANVSHELRTPLTIIQGYAEAIQDGLARKEGREEEYLQNILDEVQRLRRLVDDLLDLRRMEAGQVQIKKEPVVLPPLIQRVVARFLPVAKEKGVTLAYFCRDNLPSVAGDADRLEQVLNNLVDNAVRYTPAGGKISIAAEPAPGGAQVTVSDTGPGVPEEELPLIWERFYKADKARLRSGAGSGLGLAIARQIIELHGGTIEAKSRPGEGTSFTFHLPLFRSEKL